MLWGIIYALKVSTFTYFYYNRTPQRSWFGPVREDRLTLWKWTPRHIMGEKNKILSKFWVHKPPYGWKQHTGLVNMSTGHLLFPSGNKHFITRFKNNPWLISARNAECDLGTFCTWKETTRILFHNQVLHRLFSLFSFLPYLLQLKLKN